MNGDSKLSGPAIKVGVGAVVFRGDDALVIRRAKPPFSGKWSIPGGAVEWGERLEDAVIREVREETGVEIRLGGFLGVFEAVPRTAPGEALHVVMIDYWAEWIAGEPVAGDDASAAEFVPLTEALARVSWDQTRTAIARAVKLRDTANQTP